MGALQHHADVALQPVQGTVAVVHAVDQHLPLGGFVEAAQHVHQRALAASGRAHDGDGLTARDGQVHLIEHRMFRVISERDVLELDLVDTRTTSVFGYQRALRRLSLRYHRLLDFVGVFDIGHSVHQAQDAFCGCLRHLHLGKPVPQLLHRFEEVSRVSHEGHQSSGRDDTGQQVHTAHG